MRCPSCGKWAQDKPKWDYGCGPRCHPTYWVCRHCGSTFMDPEHARIRREENL